MAHVKKLVTAGMPMSLAMKALILLHGRGATAEDILTLGDHLPLTDFHLVAPQATNHTWYPYSFLSPVQQNEPWLSGALDVVGSIVNDLETAGVSSSNIYLMGFSQGACLTLEFTARNARRWGGVVAFTGGLIGSTLNKEKYNGNFLGTPVLMTNSQNDPHVPLLRSEESKQQLQGMGASVTLEIFQNRPHTILREELQHAAALFQ